MRQMSSRAPKTTYTGNKENSEAILKGNKASVLRRTSRGHEIPLESIDFCEP